MVKFAESFRDAHKTGSCIFAFLALKNVMYCYKIWLLKVK